MIIEDRFKVGYQQRGSTHHCALSDGRQTWFFDLMEGKYQQTPSRTSTLDLTGGDARKYGTGDPHHSHMQQRSFEGGRGRYEFDEDETSYFDSGFANTMIPGRVAPVGQWRFGEGYNYSDVLMPGCGRYDCGDDVHWVPLTALNTSFARSFTATASPYTATRAMLWVRKKGQPVGDLGFRLKANAGDAPTGAALTSDTLTASDVDDDGLSKLVELTISHAQSASTKYWAEVYISAAGDDSNHWEVGYGQDAYDSCLTSTDGATTYVPTGVQIYFRLAPAVYPGKWRMFTMEGALYAAGDRRDGVATAQIYINGDRGKATAGSTTTLTCSTKSWSVNLWTDAWVRATKGTGAGQRVKITSNTSTQLTFAAVDLAFDSTTEFVIYATDEWTGITLSGTAVTDPVKDVTVFDNMALLCFGSGSGDAVMLRIKWDATTGTHLGIAESNSEKADNVHAFNDGALGAVVWRSENSQVTVSRAPVAAWNTALTWGGDIDVGDSGWLIRELMDHQGQLYVSKEDSLWYISNDRATRVTLGFDTMADITNGIALLSWKLHLYMNWSSSIEQIYGGNVNDVGPWRYAGLPSGRTGVVAAMLGTHAFLLAAIDADDRTSSVHAWNEMGYHEMFRSWQANRRCESLAWQSCPGTRDRLWISVGGDLVVMEQPLATLNPLNDADYRYHHEWWVDTSSFDMSSANLSKLFQRLSITSQNLRQGTEIELLYQVDSEVGGADWIPIKTIVQSPFAQADIHEGERRRIRLRYIGRTEDADNPPVLIAPVLEGLTRLPNKYAFSWLTGTSSWALQGGVGQRQNNPDDFVEWCEFCADNAVELTLHSIFRRLDDIRVVIEPIVVGVRALDKDSGGWEGDVQMTVREA